MCVPGKYSTLAPSDRGGSDIIVNVGIVVGDIVVDVGIVVGDIIVGGQ